MVSHHSNPELYAKELHNSGLPVHDIEDKLVESGITRFKAVEICKGLKSESKINENKRRRGFLLIGIGGFLLVFGFLITVLLYHQGMAIETAMYVPTIVGVLLVMGGLIYLFN